MGRVVARAAGRVVADRHVLLALALIAPVVAIQLLGGLGEGRVVAAIAGVFLAAQIGMRRVRSRLSPGNVHLARLALATIFVTVVSRLGPSGDGTPAVLVLSIPIVAFAAMHGVREALFVAAIALVGFALAVASKDAITLDATERVITVGVTGLVLSIGTRRTIASLRAALLSARRAMTALRRRDRQLAAIGEVGSLLARAGPTDDALDGVMDLLVERFGYRLASIYLGDDQRMRLGAQRGYDDPTAEFSREQGVIGRVMRTRQPDLVPDVTVDPDYRAAHYEVASHISVPLLVSGQLIGIVNVESSPPQRLDVADLNALRLVAEQLASALELAWERDRLSRRVAAFEGLSAFGQRLTGTLDPDDLHGVIAQAVALAIPCDFVTLVLLDEATGEYRLVAVPGDDGSAIGRSIEPGEGVAGRAISEGRVVVDEQVERAQFPAALGHRAVSDVVAMAAAPLVRDDRVFGALAVGRNETGPTFDDLDREVLPLLAHQAALAVTNARLHAATMEASIRDPLTGLYNRRHLDATIERMSAARARLAPELRRPMSAILFDLDQFGRFNKRYGHAIGDEILRRFAALLHDRFRASDVLARYGGEEFVVLLDGAPRSAAVRLAEEIRAGLCQIAVHGPNGEVLQARVSAGCAGLDPDAATLDGLLETADVGLAMAKHAGRNQVVAA